MKLIVNYASTDDANNMVLPYYNFFTALYGKTMLSPLIRHRLEKGKELTPAASVFDNNTGLTFDAINEGFESENISMLEIRDGDFINPETGMPEIIAYARICWALNYPYSDEKNPKNAGIPDVALVYAMSEDVAEEFYVNFIIAMEDWIMERNENTDLITHEVPRNNDAYIGAMYDVGTYSFKRDPYNSQSTILYDHYVRNKPRTRQIIQNNKQ